MQGTLLSVPILGPFRVHQICIRGYATEPQLDYLKHWCASATVVSVVSKFQVLLCEQTLPVVVTSLRAIQDLSYGYVCISKGCKCPRLPVSLVAVPSRNFAKQTPKPDSGINTALIAI